MRAAVDLGDARRHAIEEVAVVGHQQQGAVPCAQAVLEPLRRARVEVVGRLVEDQQIGPRQEGAASATRRRSPMESASTSRSKGGQSRSAARPRISWLDVPAAEVLERLLQARLLGECGVQRGAGRPTRGARARASSCGHHGCRAR
jgi:hypothetical protein